MKTATKYCTHKKTPKTFLKPKLKLNNNKTKLEIWGKAQRESAQRPKSDWGKLEERVRGGRISPASKSRGLNSNALAYAECALST